MAEIEDNPGSAIEIDGVDIRTIGLQYLRKNLCIIPQTPVILSGTVKRNLDPFDEYSEE
jgi:ABC-type multidrug transport system fused ATPase/permease subunit